MNNNKVKRRQIKQMEVEVGFPEQIRMDLVPANELKHYEVSMWLGSLFLTAASSFWVAFASSTFNKVLFGVSIVLSIFTFVFIGAAVYYRGKLKCGTLIKKIPITDLRNVV